MSNVTFPLAVQQSHWPDQTPGLAALTQAIALLDGNDPAGARANIVEAQGLIANPTPPADLSVDPARLFEVEPGSGLTYFRLLLDDDGATVITASKDLCADAGGQSVLGKGLAAFVDWLEHKPKNNPQALDPAVKADMLAAIAALDGPMHAAAADNLPSTGQPLLASLIQAAADRGFVL